MFLLTIGGHARCALLEPGPARFRRNCVVVVTLHTIIISRRSSVRCLATFADRTTAANGHAKSWKQLPLWQYLGPTGISYWFSGQTPPFSWPAPLMKEKIVPTRRLIPIIQGGRSPYVQNLILHHKILNRLHCMGYHISPYLHFCTHYCFRAL